VVLAPAVKCAAPVVPGEWNRRVERDGLGVVGDGPVGMAQFEVSITQVAPGVGIIRVQLNRPGEVGDGLLEPTEIQVRSATVIPAERVLWSQLDGRVVVVQSLPEAA